MGIAFHIFIQSSLAQQNFEQPLVSSSKIYMRLHVYWNSELVQLSESKAVGL